MHVQNISLTRQKWYFLYAAGIAVMLLFWWRATGSATTGALTSVEMAAGNLTGLVGTYAILWQLVLLSRLPFLERDLGMEHLTRLHKWNGYAALSLIILHAVFLTLAFAALDHANLIGQFLDFLTHWEDVLKATVGLAMLIGIVAISIGIVRRGLKYETWFYVHFTTYLAIALGFEHQLSVGSDFLSNPGFTAYWLLLYVLAFGSMLLFRFVRPVYLLYRQRFTVAKIVREAPDVISIYVTGRHLEELRYEPGQFMIWRFLTKDLWWQAHPFSLSTAPDGHHLRLTVKAVGDFTRQLPSLKPGAPVLVDGPHGNFTARRTTGPDLLLIAGGVGITPIRAMMEQLPERVRSAVLVYTARNAAGLALRQEISGLAAKHNITVHYLLSEDSDPGAGRGLLDDASLRKLVPDASRREVLLCGPPAMMDAVTHSLERQGVSRRLIHTERFAY